MKILIANRGEIAVRIGRACREMGLRSVGVYSDPDRKAPHVRYVDEAYPLGGSTAVESYLSIEKLIEVARRAKADAVHPAYGFLAENAGFATACRDAGLTFIGPSADVIDRMGSKVAARETAIAAGVPVVPGTEASLPESLSSDGLQEAAAAVGYPVLVKAVAGGGGKGMRVASNPSELVDAIRAARSEAASAFGDSSIYLERRLERPRHVEIQLLGDTHGLVVGFVERECSIQRRHQKVIEESPSVAVSAAQREALVAAAVAVARRVGYTSAGTIEFLLDADGEFYFLEMNTRLQVEHPVTELVTDTDLVHWQIRIARGERIDLDQERLLRPRGHAIECRIYAEDPDNGFLPSPGRITRLRPPSGPGIRDDSGVEAGFEVPVYYDPMISKLVGWGHDRAQAIARLQRAVSEYEIAGIRTSLPFFRWLLSSDAFVAGRFDTAFLDGILASRNGLLFAEPSAEEEEIAAIGAALHGYFESRRDKTVTAGRDGSAVWKRAARMDGLRFRDPRD